MSPKMDSLSVVTVPNSYSISMKLVALLYVVLVVAACAAAPGPQDEDRHYHPKKSSRQRNTTDAGVDPAEHTAAYWHAEAQAALDERLQNYENLKTARNVVMFLGDGLSVPTLAAARTLLGQRQGRPGEESRLAFETFPAVGLAKTYCVDAQIPDSACTATAYLGGVKANRGTIGVTAAVTRSHCSDAADPVHHVLSIATWALEDGRDVGIVTTTRVTHASPAGAYAHTANRDWESDADLLEEGCAPGEASQRDIAYQLVHNYPGNRFKVILGGGRREMRPNTTVDEEGTLGRRRDGRDLIAEWQAEKAARNVSYSYVWNREQLLAAPVEDEYLLGLFEGSHMQYHLEADARTEPTLAELTEAAIRRLSRNPRGYFLFVEGGRIDHAHHDNLVHLALDETLELSEAVARAGRLVGDDTLLVLTADHAHVMSFNGYTRRGGDILGLSDDLGDDNVPYLTLSYANGPGFQPHVAPGVRADVSQYDYRDIWFARPAAVPLESETHGGDDVAVFASGPRHHVFSGLYEQSQLPHLMGYAACLGPGRHACHHLISATTLNME